MNNQVTEGLYCCPPGLVRSSEVGRPSTVPLAYACTTWLKMFVSYLCSVARWRADESSGSKEQGGETELLPCLMMT